MAFSVKNLTLAWREVRGVSECDTCLCAEVVNFAISEWGYL